MSGLLLQLSAWASQRALTLLGTAAALAIAGYGIFYYADIYRPFSSLGGDSTIATFRSAVVKNPDDISARVRLATAYMDKGEMDAAGSEFREILKASPDLAVAITGLGLVYFNQGRNQQALEQFEKIIRNLADQPYAQFSPDVNNAYYYSGVILLREGRFQEAEAFLRKAVATNGADGDARMYLGWALCRMARCEEGLTETSIATRFLPNESEPHYYRGLILERLGRHDEATQELGLAMKYRPDYPEAAEALRRVWMAKP